MSPMVWTMIAVLTVALFYILVPYGMFAFAAARRPRLLTCPQSLREASVQLDAIRAGLTAPLRGLPVLRVRACSEWPQRAGCDQACMKGAILGAP